MPASLDLLVTSLQTTIPRQVLAVNYTCLSILTKLHRLSHGAGSCLVKLEHVRHIPVFCPRYHILPVAEEAERYWSNALIHDEPGVLSSSEHQNDLCCVLETMSLSVLRAECIRTLKQDWLVLM